MSREHIEVVQHQNQPVKQFPTSEFEFSQSAEQEVHIPPKYEQARTEKQVTIDDYSDVFHQQEIDADKIALAQKLIREQAKEASTSPEEQQSSKETKKLATLLEDITVLLGNSPAWIPNARFIKASEYDDHCKGTDLIIEIAQGKTGRPITLAVDVTIGRHQVSKKVNNIVAPGDRIFEKPSLKYYPAKKYEKAYSPDKPTTVLKLALGASGDTVLETQTALRAANTGDNEAKILARHQNRLKHAILFGGLAQCEGLRDYANAVGDTTHAKAYEVVAKYFRHAIETHEKIFGPFPQSFEEREDDVLHEIRNVERNRYTPAA